MTDQATKIMVMKHERRETGEISLEYHKKGFIILSDRLQRFNTPYERVARVIDDSIKNLEGKKGTYVCFENILGKYRIPEEGIKYGVTKQRAREYLDEAIQKEFKGVDPEKRNKQRESLAEKAWDWINSID